MPPLHHSHSGRRRSGRDGPRRGRPNHGVERAAHSIPAPDQEAFKAAVRAEVARQLAELSVNAGDSNITGVEESDPQYAPTRGGARSSREGYAGRNSRGGSHLGRGRVSHNNNQATHSSETASSDIERRRLPVATASELIWVADREGDKAAKIVNHTPLSGNTDAFAQQRPGNQRWGITPGYGLNEEAKDLLEGAGPEYTRVIYQMIAVSEEHFNAVSQNAVEKTIEDHNGKNVEGKNALLMRAGVDPHPKEDEDEEEQIKCKVCGSPTHTVSTCFSHPRQGQTFGCPLCDAGDHTGSECAAIARLPLIYQVKLLITNRGNMPAFHEGDTKQSWWKLLHKFCMSAEYDQELLGDLPWGRGYSKKLSKQGRDLKELQKQYDENEGISLPADPSTESLGRVARKWDRQGLTWPQANLGERPEMLVHGSGVETRL